MKSVEGARILFGVQNAANYVETIMKQFVGHSLAVISNFISLTLYSR